MKVTFLGTNGWCDTDTGNTVCALVETSEQYIVLDAGFGFFKVADHIKEDKPIYIFLSHFHLDHVVGLHALDKFRILDFRPDVKIYGQPGTKEIINIINNKPLSMPIPDLPCTLEVIDLLEGTHNVPFKVTCKPLVHADPCFGFRFELEGKVLTYCTDTGPCENLGELAKDADLLITECAYAPGKQSGDWPHLNPAIAAGIAKKAGAKELVLTHFDAWQYQTRQSREEAERIAREIFPNTTAAFDDTEVEV